MPAFVLQNSRDDARSDISVRQAYGSATPLSPHESPFDHLTQKANS
jgi:hypothetical protein